jgi:uncharacterized membrane protein YebE (DUF533 family)
MGFLDRLVADMVGDATRLPVKRIVRGVGVKNLLLLGGAAAAGGVAMHKLSQGRNAGSARPTTTPPPPPPTSQARVPPPPPPPPPTSPAVPLPPLPAAQVEPELAPSLVAAIVRTMVAAALADGHLAAEEKTAIEGRLGESGLAEDAVQQIHRDLVVPPSPEELAQLLDDPAAAAVLYRAALLVIKADSEVGQLELTWLQRLAAALGLDASRRQELEADLATL